MHIGDRMLKALDKVGSSPVFSDRGLSLRELTDRETLHRLIDDVYVTVDERVHSGHRYYGPGDLSYPTICREVKAYGVYRGSGLKYRIACLPYIDFLYVVSDDTFGVGSCIDYMWTGIEDMSSDGIAALVLSALVRVDTRCEGLFGGLDPEGIKGLSGK